MNPPILFDALRKSDLFGGRVTPKQVQGINGVLAGFAKVGDGRPKTLAYGLATVRRECGADMLPVREGFAKSDAAARAYVKRQGYRYAEVVGGQCFYGRGFVQLTWAANYKASSEDAGVDLLANPDAALDPDIAGRLLFLGLQDGRWNGSEHRGIAFYLPDAGPDDLKGARRTVNGTDHWQDIAGYYRTFLAAIQAAGGADAARDVQMDLTDAEAAALQGLMRWKAKTPPPEDFAAYERVVGWLKEMPA